jgi:hypothetical protein
MIQELLSTMTTMTAMHASHIRPVDTSHISCMFFKDGNNRHTPEQSLDNELKIEDSNAERQHCPYWMEHGRRQ